MGILSKQITSGLTEMAHPLLQADACVNYKQRRTGCTTCSDLCPEHVLINMPKGTPDWLRCTNCDLCVSACPSRALASHPDTRKKYLEGRDLSQTVIIGCAKETQNCSLKVPCAASLPWELIAYLALHTKVVLYLNACPACDRKDAWEQLRNNLKEAMRFLGEPLFREHVILIQGGTYEEEVHTYSRREIFSALGKSMTRAALELVPKLPGESEADSEGLFYRYLLANAVYKKYQAAKNAAAVSVSSTANSANASSSTGAAQEATAGTTSAPTPVPAPATPAPRTYPVRLPKFTDQCYGCGSCMTLCPGKAPELSSEKNGIRTIYITPWRCSACGLCADVCRQGGVKSPDLFALKHLHMQPLVNIHTRSCSVCGAVISPKSADGLCVVCRQRAKRKNIKH